MQKITEKQRLLNLVADMPEEAIEQFAYLYSFIGFGILEGMFVIEEGHEEELKEFKRRKKLLEEEREKKEKEEKKERKISELEKNRLETISMLFDINNLDIMQYIHTIVKDIHNEQIKKV